MSGFDEKWLQVRLAAGNIKVAGTTKSAPRGAKLPPPKGKPRRYRNEPVENEHGKFDSKHELSEYLKLLALEKAGAISDLKRQVPFILAPAVKLGGRMKPALKIIVDFTFKRGGVLVAADAKSEITKKKDAYRIKKHLLKHVWALDIEEI